MLIGYARVSTEEQTLATQLHALETAGCKIILQEKRSGADKDRPELTKLLRRVAADDIIIVHRLDRLARSTQHLLEISSYLRTKNVGLCSISEPWADTTSPAGRMILTIFAGIAEFERALIRDRTEAGRQLARERGVHLGRPAKLNKPEIALVRKMIVEDGIPISDVASRFGVHKATIYRIVSKYQMQRD
ncbi:recombinase family protein [Novacetimonas pomaceti]|uniref:Resolvase n=1 Tax=Novacetimonas pomaceti TaxID=2021998 RepID=A0A318Q6S8_9PROT|nr:recombinase family protein [Novacetimonas pomaceti]PYD74450.1 resolvase [Novacetimonas pomaceti]